MFNTIIDRRVFADASWWHWTLTIPLLAAALAGRWWGAVAAMALCAAAGSYFWARIRELRPLPVQVRIAYFGLLAIGTLPYMSWIHWIQLAGTTSMVTVGYCPLIRMLMLLPLNRSERLTWSLAWRVFACEPCRGGLVQWKANQSCEGAACSLPAARPSSVRTIHSI